MRTGKEVRGGVIGWEGRYSESISRSFRLNIFFWKAEDLAMEPLPPLPLLCCFLMVPQSVLRNPMGSRASLSALFTESVRGSEDGAVYFLRFRVVAAAADLSYTQRDFCSMSGLGYTSVSFYE